MKKWMTGLLAVCLILSLAMPVFAALPTGTGIITSCKAVSGSEFSPKSAIAKKLDKMFAGDIGLYVDKAKTKLVNAALGTQNVPNNGKYQYWANGHAGTSCFAYANAFYGKLYDGFSPHDKVNGNHQRVKATGIITYQNFVKWGVRNDAAVYIREGNHSVIVLHYDEDYITYVDGNGNGKGLIALRKEAWKRGSGSNIYNQTPSLIVQPKTSYFAKGSMQQKQPVPCTKGGSFHDWDEGVITQKATCKEKGLQVYTCLACGKTKEEAIAKTTNHTYGQWSVTKEATCTKKGTQSAACTLCGKKNTKTVKALGHDYGKQVTVKEATIFSVGLAEKACTRCSYAKTKELPCSFREEALQLTLETQKGSFPKDTQIAVTRLGETTAAFGESQLVLAEVTGKFALYDLYAYVQDQTEQPKKPVTLQLKIPDGLGENLALYMLNEDQAEQIESTYDAKKKLLTARLTQLGSLAVCDLDVPWMPPVEETTEPVTEPVTQPVTEAETEPATVAAEQAKEENQPVNSYILLIAAGIAVLLAGYIAVLVIVEMKRRKKEQVTNL